MSADNRVTPLTAPLSSPLLSSPLLFPNKLFLDIPGITLDKEDAISIDEETQCKSLTFVDYWHYFIVMSGDIVGETLKKLEHDIKNEDHLKCQSIPCLTLIGQNPPYGLTILQNKATQ